MCRLVKSPKISYAAEDGLIWRRDLKPAITVRANIASGTANDAAQKAYDATADIRANLPLGYSIKADGALADSKDSIDFLLVPVPVMLFLIATLLMLQLRDPAHDYDLIDCPVRHHRCQFRYAFDQ